MIAIPYRKEAAAVVDALVNQGPKDRPATIADVQRNLWQSSDAVIGGAGALQLKNQ